MRKQPNSRLYLITGSDPAQIAAAGKKLVEKMVGDNPDPFLCDTISESENITSQEALKQTVDSVNSPPFMGGDKTVWLKNFSAFNQEKKTGPMADLFAGLYAVIERGIPEDIHLVLSGPEVDRRKKLYRLCKTHGTLMEYSKPEIGQKQWNQQMAQIIEAETKEKGVAIEPAAVDYLIQVIGTDTARVEPELEKLISYCADTPEKPLSLAAARQICQGDGETAAWAIRDAMAERNLERVLQTTRTIFQAERDGDRAILNMIRQTADHFYSMLQAMLLIRTGKMGNAYKLSANLKNMSNEEKTRWAEKGLEIVYYHHYRVQIIALQADKYTGPELVQAVKILRDGYWQCISSSVPSRIIWEKTVTEIIDGKA